MPLHASPRRAAVLLPLLINLLLPLAVSFAYLLPVDAAPAAMNLSLPVIAAPLLAFHLVYTRRHGLRA
ncbi:hypothetical protein ACWD4P_12920 [Kitasatospora sp. NPDC002543]